MIYFARIGDDGPIKIGTTIDLAQRMVQLASIYGVKPRVLAIRDGGRAEERAHHRKFAHLRLGKSEEFRPGPDLLAYIESECRKPDLLDGLREDGRPKQVPPVRIPRDIIRLAKIVAAFEGQSVGHYLNRVLRPAVERDYCRLIERVSEC